MRIKEGLYLDYQDVLIHPKRSVLESRADVDLVRTFKLKNSQQTLTCIPVLASNMSCVGTIEMAHVFSRYNMIVCLHKYIDLDKVPDDLMPHVFLTIGSDKDDFVKFCAYIDKRGWRHNPHLKILIDVANGYSQHFVYFVEKVREYFPTAPLMVGNVASPEMVQELLLAGADIIKIGIGSGSACTTRIVAGIGVPQFTSTIKCADAAHGLDGHICSDGGIVYPGDMAKGFGGGSDFIMCGGILAGTDECDGEWEYEREINWNKNIMERGNLAPPEVTDTIKKKWFKFYGMSSAEAQQKYSGGVLKYRASEGKSVKVPYKGPVEDTIQQILGGLRSACTYVGANSLKNLSKCCTFIRVNRTHNTTFSSGENT